MAEKRRPTSRSKPNPSSRAAEGSGTWTARATEVVASLLRLRFVRFLLIGVVNTIFGYSIFAAMFLATGQPELSIIVATAIGVLFNFMSTGRVVFGNDADRQRLIKNATTVKGKKQK